MAPWRRDANCRVGADTIIRPGHDSDAARIIDLIAACWGMYPGVRMDVDGEMPELHALATYYAGAGGALWVAEERGRAVGMVAVRPHGGSADAVPPHDQAAGGARPHDGPAGAPRPVWEICRVYVDPSQHGGGLGHRLLDVAEAHAIAAGAERLVLWSDTRFDRAHRFYEKRSYVRSGPIRVLQDISQSLEFAYAKPVSGIEALDAAAAASAERRLAGLLIACVVSGDGLSFLPPLAPATARAFWKQGTRDIAAGTRILLCSWVDGVLVGAVMLDLGTPPNQPHRAEVQKLMVHPDARRRGLARTLMLRTEQAAVRAGRSLLTLEARAGDAGEALYRAMGWTELGCIPGHAVNADGVLCDTVFFWKRL